MPKDVKLDFLAQLEARYGPINRLPNSQSLYSFANGAGLIYIRYSKPHGGCRTFYGLREQDLRQLSGRQSLICFLWDNQPQPLTVPFADYEEVFHSVQPASDGQYKVQVYVQESNTELYIAQAGRFNVEGNFGWEPIQTIYDGQTVTAMPQLS